MANLPAQQPIPSVEPSAVLTLPTDVAGRNVFGSVSVDGAQGLVHVRHPGAAVEWWERAIWFAPDAALVAIPLAVLVLAGAVRRMLRRPQVPGRWYCAACNYELAVVPGVVLDAGGVPTGRCPECGVEPALRPPRAGRASRRRFGPVIACATIVLLASLVILVTRIERAPPGMNWAQAWPMPILGEYVPGLRLTKVSPPVAQGFSLMTYSIKTGEHVATPISRRAALFLDMAASADGELASFSLFEVGTGVGYQLNVMPVIAGKPAVPVALAEALHMPLGAVGVGLSPVAVSRRLPEGSRWLYFSRSWMITRRDVASFRTELVRVRVKEGQAVGVMESVAVYEPEAQFGPGATRQTPYHRWLVHEDEGSDAELSMVRAALFLDEPPSTAAAGTATTTRGAIAVAFPKTTSAEIARAQSPLTGRTISASYAGTSFYPPRLSSSGRVLEFEPYMSATTVSIDLEAGAVTQTPAAAGMMLVIEHLGWRATSGRLIIDSAGTTIATLAGGGTWASPSAGSPDGRWVAGFSHSQSGMGWWNQLGIGPWNKANVNVWDLSEIPGWTKK